MSLIETIKERPVVSGAIGVAALIILYLLFKGGGSTAPTASAGYDVGAATDAYNTQQQAQLQAQQISGALAANADNNATASHIAELQASLQSKTVDASQTVALSQINAAQQYQSLLATLTAQTQQAVVTGDVNKARIASDTTITTGQQLANVLTAQTAAQVEVAKQNAGVAIASINANAATNQAIIANQCSGFFDCLF